MNRARKPQARLTSEAFDPAADMVARRVRVRRDSPLREQAVSAAIDMGSLRGSIERGAGNVAGLLAELVFVDVVGGTRDATYDYDVRFAGHRVDVKTKRRTVPPQPHYECSVAEFNTEQTCDWYYFTSVDIDAGVVWLLGYLPREVYYETATFHEEGDYDPDNGFRFSADCYNVPIRELRQHPAVAALPAPDGEGVAEGVVV